MESDRKWTGVIDTGGIKATAPQQHLHEHAASHDSCPPSSSCVTSASSSCSSSYSVPECVNRDSVSASSLSAGALLARADSTEQQEGKYKNGNIAASSTPSSSDASASSMSVSISIPASFYGDAVAPTPRFYSPIELPLPRHNSYFRVGIGTAVALPCCGVTLFRCPVCLAANLTKSFCCSNCQLFDLFQHELASHLTDHLYGRMQWNTGLFVVIPPASSRPNDPAHWTEAHIRAWLVDTKQTTLAARQNLSVIPSQWPSLFEKKWGELDQVKIRSLTKSDFLDLSTDEFDEFHLHLQRLLDDRLEQGFDHTAMIPLPVVTPIKLTADQMRRLLDAKPLTPFTDEWLAVDAFKWLRSIGASVEDLLVLQELASLPEGDPRNWSVWQWEAFLFPLRKRWNNLQYSANLQLLLYRLQWAYGEQMNPTLPYSTDVWYESNNLSPLIASHEDCCFGRIDKDRHIPASQRLHGGGGWDLTRSPELRAQYAASKSPPAPMSPTDIFSEAPWSAPFVPYPGAPVDRNSSYVLPLKHLIKWSHVEVKYWFIAVGFTDIARYLREEVDGAYFVNMELFEWVNVVDASYGCCALSLSARMTLTRLIDWLRSHHQLPPMRWLLSREKCRTHGPQYLHNLREQQERAMAAADYARMDPMLSNLSEEQLASRQSFVEQLQRNQERTLAHMQYVQMHEQMQRHRKVRRRASQHVQRVLKEMQMNKVLEDAALELEGKKANSSDSDEEKNSAEENNNCNEEKKESQHADRFHIPPLPPAPAATANVSIAAQPQADAQCSVEGLGSPKVAPAISKNFGLLPSAASPSFAASQAKSLLGRTTTAAAGEESSSLDPAALGAAATNSAGVMSPTTPRGTHRRRVSFNKSEFHKYFHREEETDRLYVLVHAEAASSPHAPTTTAAVTAEDSTTISQPVVVVPVVPVEPIVSPLAIAIPAPAVPAASAAIETMSKSVAVVSTSDIESNMADVNALITAPAVRTAPILPSLTVDPTLASFDTFTATPLANTPTTSSAAFSQGFSPSNIVAQGIVKSFSLVTSPTAREVALTPKGPLRSILKKRCHSAFAATSDSTASAATTRAVTFGQEMLPPAILPTLMSNQEDASKHDLDGCDDDSPNATSSAADSAYPRGTPPRSSSLHQQQQQQQQQQQRFSKNKRARGEHAMARALELNASPVEMMALREMKVSAFGPATASASASGSVPATAPSAVERDETIKLNVQESGMSLSLQRLLCPEMFTAAPASSTVTANAAHHLNSSSAASSSSTSSSLSFSNHAQSEDISLSTAQDIDDYSSSDEEDEKKGDAMTD